MKLAKTLDRTILVIGIGLMTYMLLWSVFTGTAEASELQPSTMPVGPVVPAAYQAEPPVWGVWVERPMRLPWPHQKENPLCPGRKVKRKQSYRGRTGGRVRPGGLREQASETHGEPVRPVLQSSVQRPERSLSEGHVVSTATLNVQVMPLTVCIPKPTVTSVTASVWSTCVMESRIASERLGVPVVSPMTAWASWVSVSTASLAVTSQVSQEDAACQTWVAGEMAALDLGDQRLNRRACCLVEQFAARSTASIPGACGTWAKSKAAYRFFDNPRITHSAVLAGHRPACLARIQQESLILAVQDTTSLNYSSHPNTRGLGTLDNAQGLGLMVHTCLAVSEAGTPLGLLAQHVWARDPESKGQWEKRKQRPIEEKESFKWIAAQRAALHDMSPQVQVITVGDQEADVYELFQEADNTHTHFLVRASRDRCLNESEDYLHAVLTHALVQGEFTVEVARTPDRLPRRASVQVRFTSVTLKPPARPACQTMKLTAVRVYAIEVREIDPPSDEEALHWLLLTNRRVETFEQAQQCVRWYCLRWLVERYHFVLKSGCQIEARQLETAKRLECCLGVYAIVAWRLLWLTYQSRCAPDLLCTIALTTLEWQALYCYIHKTATPPNEPPTLHQATRWIAQLGGFLGRKRDGEPGAKVLWRGWQRLNDIAETWHLAHPSTEKDVGNG